MYQRILVPIDDSDTDDAMLREVSRMYAEHRDRTIILFHVLRPVHPLTVGAGYVVDTGDVQTRMEQDGYQILKRAREKLSHVGVASEQVLEWGEPAHEISRYAKRQDVDLIVVGNKDKSLLDKLLSGSVRQQVIEKAPADVLVVK
ncbi:universal stress protein YxiE [Alicyclobacillus acidoterrestris]|uniref:universal stress protein n=1 Tax=Alicyclobacillus suci TaxID=2816080 RepID=UPI00118FDF11|nr:universal stress protein [Alicyclobacillus suci]GEO27800.1 universal stress protein YxiE [Alicyclobacillus acidoterrestris]